MLRITRPVRCPVDEHSRRFDGRSTGRPVSVPTWVLEKLRRHGTAKEHPSRTTRRCQRSTLLTREAAWCPVDEIVNTSPVGEVIAAKPLYGASANIVGGWRCSRAVRPVDNGRVILSQVEADFDLIQCHERPLALGTCTSEWAGAGVWVKVLFCPMGSMDLVRV
jgi:hypothetical protein